MPEYAHATNRPAEPGHRLHQCTSCDATFQRGDHLTRHMKSHAGGKQYRCPCGSSFSRNDVLARHIRQYHKTVKPHELEGTSSAKQTRSKTACDRCAKSKLKCNSQKPCQNCTNKSFSCQYTRRGYSDPYSPYRVPRDQGQFESQASLHGSTMHKTSDKGDGHPPTPPASYTMVDHIPSDQELIQFAGPSGEHVNLPEVESNMDYLTFGQHNFQDDLDPMAEAQVPPDLDFGAWMNFFLDPGTKTLDQPNLPAAIPNLNLNIQDINWPAASAPDFEIPQVQSGHNQIAPAVEATEPFSLHQIDPLESKCAEMWRLFEESDAKDLDVTCITRENLVTCIGLCGKHFLPNIPILHPGTFHLTETRPILLLAMMLVGACYSENVIPAPNLYDLATRLLVIINNQPHEINMEAPPLSVIQASVMLCSMLVCSNDEKAIKFVSMHHFRNISMAERAGLFDPGDQIDHQFATESTFVWSRWIEQETRRRVACQIFCHDLGRCLFMKRSPSLSPLTFNVGLPSYQCIWNARSAAECLSQLQTLPGQTRLSTATKRIRSGSSANEPLFEASALGMFIILIGLHALLFQATQEDFESDINAPAFPSVPPTQEGDPTSLLQQNFSGCFISAIADDLVTKYGSETLKGVNRALDTWRMNWDLRSNRDDEHGNSTFSGDPMRFWWLAKLCLGLHFYRHRIRENSEFALSPNPEGIGDAQGRMQIQSKILDWWFRLRQQDAHTQPGHGSLLSRVMKRMDGL